MTMNKPASDVQAVELFGQKYRQLKAEVNKVIIGQDAVVDDVLIAIFSRGHCLLVGVPGLAKTLLVNTVAKSLVCPSTASSSSPT